MNKGRPTLSAWETLTVNFRIPLDIWKQFKVRCTRENTTASAKIRELIEGWLKD